MGVSIVFTCIKIGTKNTVYSMYVHKYFLRVCSSQISYWFIDALLVNYACIIRIPFIFFRDTLSRVLYDTKI